MDKNEKILKMANQVADKKVLSEQQVCLDTHLEIQTYGTKIINKVQFFPEFVSLVV